MVASVRAVLLGDSAPAIVESPVLVNIPNKVKELVYFSAKTTVINTKSNTKKSLII